MPGGGDWSGEPGHVCEICNRRSENVGPRRGFDYENDVCGGCCDISSDDDGHNEEDQCRSCKKSMYKDMCHEVDNYCYDCVGQCKVCDHYFHPKYIERCSTPLDAIIWTMIEEDDVPEDVLGDDAKFGEDLIELCRECKRIWKRRAKQSQTRPRKDHGESESDYGEGTSSRLQATPLTFPRDEQKPCMPKDSGNDLSSSTIPATKRKKEEAATASKKPKVEQE